MDDTPGTGTIHPGVNATVTRDVSTASTLWSAYVKNSRQLKRGKRGLTLGVYGGLGHHRLPMVGSGDTLQVRNPLAPPSPLKAVLRLFLCTMACHV